MKLLLDQGLPRSTVAHLANFGISAEHVGDLGMAAATDEAILDAARQDQAVVVTLDADFHRLLAAARKTKETAMSTIGKQGRKSSARCIIATFAPRRFLLLGVRLCD